MSSDIPCESAAPAAPVPPDPTESSLVSLIESAAESHASRVNLLVHARTRELQGRLDHDLDDLVRLRRENSILRDKTGRMRRLLMDSCRERVEEERAELQALWRKREGHTCLMHELNVELQQSKLRKLFEEKLDLLETESARKARAHAKEVDSLRAEVCRWKKETLTRMEDERSRERAEYEGQSLRSRCDLMETTRSLSESERLCGELCCRNREALSVALFEGIAEARELTTKYESRIRILEDDLASEGRKVASLRGQIEELRLEKDNSEAILRNQIVVLADRIEKRNSKKGKCYRT